MRNTIRNALLVEIMLAMLFFALCGAVLLPVYGAAHDRSAEAARMNDVLLAAQNLADVCYASSDVQPRTLTCGSFTLILTVTEQQQAAGVFRQAAVTAVDDATGETLLTLPCSRYLPKREDAP